MNRHPSKPMPVSCRTGEGLQTRRRRTDRNLRMVREIGWSKQTVRVAFGSCSAVEATGFVSLPEAQSAVIRAIDTWNSIGLPTQFQLDSSVEQADIVVSWLFSHEDPERQLNNSVQAHADFPPGNNLFGMPLGVHFNADLLWAIEREGFYDIQSVALHELGHCLGLIHHGSRDSIMFAQIGLAPLFVLHDIDPETKHRIHSVYSQ